MAIKINLMPKNDGEKNKETGRRPFYFSLSFGFLILCILVFSGIYSYNNFFLKKNLENAENKNQKLQDEISGSSASKTSSSVITAVVKGKSIKALLSAHPYWVKIYELLEKITIKGVSYVKFSAEIKEGSAINIKISGSAESYETLAKQLIVFKKTKEVKEVIFKEAVGGKEGKVSFAVELNFDSNLVSFSSK